MAPRLLSAGAALVLVALGVRPASASPSENPPDSKPLWSCAPHPDAETGAPLWSICEPLGNAEPMALASEPTQAMSMSGDEDAEEEDICEEGLRCTPEPPDHSPAVIHFIMTKAALASSLPTPREAPGRPRRPRALGGPLDGHPRPPDRPPLLCLPPRAVL